MMQSGTRCSIHQCRDVMLVDISLSDRTVYCIARPSDASGEINAILRMVQEVKCSGACARRKIRRLLGLAGRTWIEMGPRLWSSEFAAELSRARDLMEDLDLAGVGNLEADARNEYDDILVAVISKIVRADDAPVLPWVELTYSTQMTASERGRVCDALNEVESILRRARLVTPEAPCRLGDGAVGGGEGYSDER